MSGNTHTSVEEAILDRRGQGAPRQAMLDRLNSNQHAITCEGTHISLEEAILDRRGQVAARQAMLDRCGNTSVRPPRSMGARIPQQ